jgi:hypothetical protein
MSDEELISEFEEHIKVNSDYSSAVVIAALYRKVFGHFPRIGLSGFQAEAAKSILRTWMPELPEEQAALRGEAEDTTNGSLEGKDEN